MKTVLITGGAGFIGSNFVKYMRENHRDYSLIVVDSLTYAGNLENLKAFDGEYVFIRADIRDADRINEVFDAYGIDYVVNFAAESHVDRSIDGPAVFDYEHIRDTGAARRREKSLEAYPDDKVQQGIQTGGKIPSDFH